MTTPHELSRAFATQQKIREARIQRIASEHRIEVLEGALTRVCEAFARSDRDGAFTAMDAFRALSRISENGITRATETECALQLDTALWCVKESCPVADVVREHARGTGHANSIEAA